MWLPLAGSHHSIVNCNIYKCYVSYSILLWCIVKCKKRARAQSWNIIIHGKLHGRFREAHLPNRNRVDFFRFFLFIFIALYMLNVVSCQFSRLSHKSNSFYSKYCQGKRNERGGYLFLLRVYTFLAQNGPSWGITYFTLWKKKIIL